MLKSPRAHTFFTLQIIAVFTVLAASCVPTSTSGLRGRLTTGQTSGNLNVALTQGRILSDNPIIISKQPGLDTNYDINKLTSVATITTESFLRGSSSCFGLTYCFEVKATKDSLSALQTTTGKWAFEASTPEFLQVNTYFHLNKMLNQYFTNLGMTYAYSLVTTDTALPSSLFQAGDKFALHTQTLVAFADCDEKNNSAYNQAYESICLGYSGDNKEIRWAHDSTILYHETGHFLNRLQMNFRNPDPNGIKSQLGNYSLYNEAGAIGEGLADFYSYYVNNRSHWGEWAAGKLGASRPLSESDPIHVPGLSESADERLSYPQFLNYDPRNPTLPAEEIHIAGGVISHYLHALTKDLQSKCEMTSGESRELVVYLLNETLAELGDLSSVGTERKGGLGKINLNADITLSHLWLNLVNPINYRSFSQTFAKNILNSIGDPLLSRCNGTYYSQDNIESLLDSYGLLLFKTYNQHRNLTSFVNINTPINPTNRKKSVLIAKNNLILDPTSGASSAFVVDNRTSIKKIIEDMVGAGAISNISPQVDTDYNNNNDKVSPGEIVGIGLNMFNNSNSTMAGVQILANDWDHADSTGKPCQLSNDLWPLESEGASTDSVSCNTVSESSFAPVCFFQSNEATSTKWISQKEFMEKIALDSSLCLDNTNSKDCFIRAIRGADQAIYSKINPKANWGATFANPTTGSAAGLSLGNIILFEISKHIPPGTIVDCRLRARFTNCEDCYHRSSTDNNDFLDVDYNGSVPFKIIHLQIPIID